MNPNRKTARAAGLLYVLVGIIGAFGIAVVPGTLIVPGDATATADRILSAGSLLRLGIVSELVSAVSLIFLAVALYRLFTGVDQRQALMVILGLAAVPISFLNAIGLPLWVGGGSMISWLLWTGIRGPSLARGGIAAPS